MRHRTTSWSTVRKVIKWYVLYIYTIIDRISGHPVIFQRLVELLGWYWSSSCMILLRQRRGWYSIYDFSNILQYNLMVFMAFVWKKFQGIIKRRMLYSTHTWRIILLCFQSRPFALSIYQSMRFSWKGGGHWKCTNTLYWLRGDVFWIY